MAYEWSRDEVQTARLSFYLRVLPSILSNVPEVTFSNDIAPLMFLYPPKFLDALRVELQPLMWLILEFAWYSNVQRFRV